MTSPLSKVVRDPRINEILSELRESVHSGAPTRISPEDVEYIRHSFREGLILGEKKLIELAETMIRTFWLDTSYHAQLVVQGRCRRSDHSGTIMAEENIFPAMATLLETPDTQLGDRYTPRCPKCEARCLVIKSFVRWTPDRDTDSALRFFTTRVKTTSNICYKVADMVFDIDFMFQRDKIYNAFSQMVTDVYGLKTVVSASEEVRPFVDQVLAIPKIKLIEKKDYTGTSKKKSGFEAFKMIAMYGQHLFEIQIQSEEMFRKELTQKAAQHRTYKEHQMDDRRELGEDYLRLYKMLRGLFGTPAEEAVDELLT